MLGIFGANVFGMRGSEISRMQLRILSITIPLLGAGLVASGIVLDRTHRESDLLADQVIMNVSNRFRLYDSVTKKFEKSTGGINHLRPVKAHRRISERCEMRR